MANSVLWEIEILWVSLCVAGCASALAREWYVVQFVLLARLSATP